MSGWLGLNGGIRREVWGGCSGYEFAVKGNINFLE